MALLKYFKHTSEVYSCQKHQATILEEKEPTVSKKKNSKRGKYNSEKIIRARNLMTHEYLTLSKIITNNEILNPRKLRHVRYIKIKTEQSFCTVHNGQWQHHFLSHEEQTMYTQHSSYYSFTPPSPSLFLTTHPHRIQTKEL